MVKSFVDTVLRITHCVLSITFEITLVTIPACSVLVSIAASDKLKEHCSYGHSRAPHCNHVAWVDCEPALDWYQLLHPDQVEEHSSCRHSCAPHFNDAVWLTY